MSDNQTLICGAHLPLCLCLPSSPAERKTTRADPEGFRTVKRHLHDSQSVQVEASAGAAARRRSNLSVHYLNDRVQGRVEKVDALKACAYALEGCDAASLNLHGRA
jgi:hypothetical protein